MDTVAYGLGRPSSSKLLLVPEGQESFPVFVHKVLRRAEVTMSVVIGALTYIERARSHLRIAVEGVSYISYYAYISSHHTS